MELLLWGLRGLCRRRLRTTLTLLSIAIGVASVVLISSIGALGRQSVQQELSSMGMDGITLTRAFEDGQSPLREEELAAVRAFAPVETATGISFSYTQIEMRGLVAKSMVMGVDSSTKDFVSLIPLHGRLISQADVQGEARVCVVDKTVAESFYHRENIVGKSIKVQLGESVQSFTVVGVVRSGGSMIQSMMQTSIPSIIYLPSSTMRTFTLTPDYDRIALRLSASPEIDATETQGLISLLEQRCGIKNGYKIEDISAQKDSLDRMLKTVSTVLSLIAGVSLLVASLGIMTIMLVSVSERTKEIGIKKSIGAGSGRILLEFLAEAFLLSAVGSVLGAFFGISAVYLGCMVLKIPFSMDISGTIAAVLVSILVGGVFGVYPAGVAAKLDPVDALRS